MSFPRYPKYRDSGIPGLGEVPDHWEVSRVGWEAWVRARLGWKGLKANEYVDDGFVLLSTPNIKTREIDFENVNFITQERYEESPEIQLREGDVLLAKDGSTLGTANIVRSLPRAATINSSIAVITPGERLDGVFLYYVFLSSYLQNTIQRIRGGMGVPHLFQDDLKRFFIPVPPSEEQVRLSLFLDCEVSKLDALIAEQRRLIELLQEKRRAVISHAVTKGLNPDAPTKDSGVEWLGEVPAHWTIPPLYARYEVVLGKMLDEKRITGRNLLPYLRNVDVQWDWINIDDLPSMDIGPHEVERFTLRPGDLLVCEGGEVGRTAIWEGQLERCAYQKALHRLRPLGPGEDPRFLYYCMSFAASSGVFEREANPNTILHLTGEKFRRYRFPCPSYPEQREISQFLDRETGTIDRLIEESQRAIDLLQERRISLITAAVTGKIDVRGLAPAEAAA